MPDPTKRTRNRVSEKIPLEAVTSRARTVRREAPRALDPRTTSRNRLTTVVTAFVVLAALLWAAPLLPLLALIVFVYGVAYANEKRKEMDSGRSLADQMSRRS